MTRDLFGGRAETAPRRAPTVTLKTPPIEIGLIHGSIHDVDGRLSDRNDPTRNQPVDALAVGLYVGEKPSGLTLELDRAISKAFLERKAGYRPMTRRCPIGT